ncbi:MAG: bacillithiol biosynthesis cysteine-adding enzyme BshC [Bacteroidetes bacterium]|nr:bacillithiol biosynthesis cysteine-adding enzyme BshC [Bacteroidota bacterium]
MIRKADILPDGYFPPLVERFYREDPEVLSLYPPAGPHADFAPVIQSYSHFSVHKRNVLASVLQKQYAGIVSSGIAESIESLRDANTFTVTTGQQIHVFLGPLYVLYKAWSAISLSRQLAAKYPQYRFVPIFWMATEDHDLEEIQTVKLWGQTYTWQAPAGGPVGRLPTRGLAELCTELKQKLHLNPEQAERLNLFEEAYSRFPTLADATRFLLHRLLGDDGLVVLDPDHPELKKEFVPVLLQELSSDKVQSTVQTATGQMKSMGLEPAISARSCNLFLIENGKRNRLDKAADGSFHTTDTTTFSLQALSEKAEESPEIFSPNVVLRPVYQQVILPNLAYVAGPSEMVYWCQLYPLFQALEMQAPVLKHRHAFTISDSTAIKWMQELKTGFPELWESREVLKNRLMQQLAGANPMLPVLKELEAVIQQSANVLYTWKHPDLKALKKTGEAWFQQLKTASEKYETELFSQEKNAALLSRLNKLKSRVADNTSPQERTQYWLEWYLVSGLGAMPAAELPESESSPLMYLDIQ